MSQRRELAFRDEQGVIDEVERLRAGCHATGNWTLAQACWHLKFALDHCLHAPASLTPSAEHAKMRPMLEGLLASGTMPPGIPTSERLTPPARVDGDAIDGFITGLKNLQGYREPHADFGPFGPVTTEQFRQFILIHSALHLGMFRPTA